MPFAYDPDQTGQDFEALDDADATADIEAFKHEVEHARRRGSPATAAGESARSTLMTLHLGRVPHHASSDRRDGGTARSLSWPAVRPAHLSSSASR